MNFKQMEKIILSAGWKFKDAQGSHYHYVHHDRPGKVTIPNHGKKDLSLRVVNSILRQAGLK
ncbi:type II toxin-antitoxin system HicA family toxin [Megamonas hypermegale]|uniref:type II toxin-antitoxin system HicA family toxin n=1 Tax=Megamonas hypermegale TaxID=158847 RepID=UPI0025A45557|nr:type II toxin-antitoxin system HicA family toxin [Megamonas hypermegale]MDM8144300.1 type II toxin-antitoxin system HicA family toxin [Megamonas hypermegale]